MLLGSGLCVSEVLGLDREQYTGKGFARVAVKGGGVRDGVPVQREARQMREAWLASRADDAPTLFSTRSGRKLLRREAAAIIRRIAAQANAPLPEAEKSRCRRTYCGICSCASLPRPRACSTPERPPATRATATSGATSSPTTRRWLRRLMSESKKRNKHRAQYAISNRTEGFGSYGCFTSSIRASETRYGSSGTTRT